jgi:hypothetical protein
MRFVELIFHESVNKQIAENYKKKTVLLLTRH